MSVVRNVFGTALTGVAVGAALLGGSGFASAAPAPAPAPASTFGPQSLHVAGAPVAVPPYIGAVSLPCGPRGRVGIDALTAQPLVCANVGAGGDHWVRSAPIVGVHTAGSPCDSAADHVSQTPDGHALLCDAGRWRVGP